MEIGIIGLPQSGKTTIFRALAGGQKSVSAFASGRLEVHSALTDVPDERLEALEGLFQPRKKTYAKVNYADIAGLEEGISRKGLPGPFISLLGQMDAFIHVVRAFENPSVPFSGEGLDPVRDLSVLEVEFLLHDLGAVERRQQRVIEGLKKGAQARDQGLREQELLERVKEGLERERPLRDLDLAPEEAKLLRGYGLLSLKPVLIVLNTGDDGQAPDLKYPHRKSALIRLPARLECEISELPAEDKAVFMEEYGLRELSLDRVIRLSYELLGLLSFFTVGEDEVRAWTIRQGATAVEAAGVIHTDLAKGFIRAEVIPFQELIDLGGLNQAKNKGKLRLEGKDYVVKDGEVVHIRHNM
jgi:ribosome-binding ATPase